ncbi:MAG: hypothetical protein H0T89_03585 [Deltaproteobacteria bacterium]|nr:hypothetical protein [Deltaproteobacteria bacterium]MDQ3296637.1 hypothetical protein [Myxococcota bacterium]
MLAPRAIVALLVAAPLVAAAAGSQVNVSGTYDSNWDKVRLTQDGDRVRGTYVCCGGGTIDGRIIEGRIIRYRWQQPSASGLGVWKIEPGGQLSGTWGTASSDQDGGRWDLVLKQGGNGQIAQ